MAEKTFFYVLTHFSEMTYVQAIFTLSCGVVISLSGVALVRFTKMAIRLREETLKNSAKFDISLEKMNGEINTHDSVLNVLMKGFTDSVNGLKDALGDLSRRMETIERRQNIFEKTTAVDISEIKTDLKQISPAVRESVSSLGVGQRDMIIKDGSDLWVRTEKLVSQLIFENHSKYFHDPELYWNYILDTTLTMLGEEFKASLIKFGFVGEGITQIVDVNIVPEFLKDLRDVIGDIAKDEVLDSSYIGKLNRAFVFHHHLWEDGIKDMWSNIDKRAHK